MMKQKGSSLSFLCGFIVIFLLPVSLQAVTVRFVTGMWGVDNQGNVAPAYIPFGESHEESLPTCILEASGLPDDEQIIHDYSDDTFSWTCGPVGGAGSTATILTGETTAPNTITQPGSYTLTITGYTRYYIQRNVNGAPVLDGPFTATLEPANDHYSLSRPVKVVEVVSIQGHGKVSTRKTAPRQRGAGTLNDNGSRREFDSGIRTPDSMNRDGGTPEESGCVPWTDGETIYAQPGAKINLNMYLNPGIAIDDDSRAKIQWGGFGNVLVNANDPRNVIITPTGFGNGLAVACFGSNCRVMQIRCVPMAVHKVEFPNRIRIKKDTTGAIYGDTAWLDNDMDGISDMIDANADSSKPYHPVAYCSTDYLQAKAKFKPNEKKCDGTTLLQESEYDARADVKRVRYSIFYAPFVVSNAVNYNANGTEVGNENEYHFAGSPYVAYFPTWAIIWYIGFGENGTSDENLVWEDSYSTHELYLTYNGHESSYETVFHIGCTQANGSTQESDIVDNIWSYFSGLQVKRKDNTPLTYYHSFLTYVYDYENLLLNTDGQCGAWADFLWEVLDIQINNVEILYRKIEADILNSDGFIVKYWTFADNGVSNNSYSHFNLLDIYNYVFPKSYQWGRIAEVTYTTGTHGQNDNYPASFFNNHQMLEYNSFYFDPSYGLKHISLQSIDNTLSGFFKMSSLNSLNIIDIVHFMKNPDGNQVKIAGGRSGN